jgi:cerevisin/serine protease
MITEDLPPMPIDSPDACVTQTGATWGIVRTAEEDLVITGEYKYEEGAGSGVTTYVLDTGIYIQHNDFGGRATWGANFVDSDDTDGNGHGTHVASTMVGSTYGLAKSATVKAVKVLNAAGSGSFAGIIAGINWVVEDSFKLWQKVKRATKSVGNMSLGGSKSTAVNDAVDAAYANDVLFSNAAGNNAGNACNYSPASAEDGIGVGASDNSDRMASFSNWGSCVDIFGPGVSITAAWIGNPTSDNTISGTSMAAPHVAGVIAKLMKDHPDFDAEKMKAEVLGTATTNKLSGVRGSPNLLCYHGCVSEN